MIEEIGQLVNLGRAAGIHVIVATQRPDIKVIPGNIKANISTRVCFELATRVDSKVVIDEE
jgi:S-DNA-T family DNA segregation ATPase FtsK/SpoIIIE